MEEYTFDAFISYSHRDLSWGTWLQKKIETFRIPKDMRGERPKGQGLRVFRDQTDLAGTELQDSLRQNLDVSRYLIVLCSPASAASSWVNEEVKYFVSLGRVSRIIPFIVDGEPLSEDPALECFPPALRSLEDHVLLGANIQEIGKDKAFLKTVSILLGVRFGRLVDREKQRRIRTALITAAVTAVIASTGGALLWRNAVISQKNRELNYDIYGAAIVSISQKDVIEPEDVAFLRASAEEGNAMAIPFLIDCYKNGWGTEQDNCYDRGEGTEQDNRQSFEWYMKAADAGNSMGMFYAGVSFERGEGVEQDLSKAFEYYKKSAEAGYDLGMYNLAMCYLTGNGTEPDQSRAFEWTQKLADTGNTYGMYNLGLMYQNGFGTEENPEMAYYWYRRAADAGDADGAYMSGWCLENGYGVTDPAKEWYRKAAEGGNEKAAEALKRPGGE